MKTLLSKLDRVGGRMSRARIHIPRMTVDVACQQGYVVRDGGELALTDSGARRLFELEHAEAVA